MPEQLRDDLDTRAGGQEHRGSAVPQVVQPDSPRVGLVDEFGEALCDSLRRDRVAVLAGEYQAVVGVRIPQSARRVSWLSR